MKKLAYDNIRFDSVKVVEDNKNYLKVQAVITKEGVYDYPDGRAFKCRKELLKAVPSAISAKLTIYDHPDSMVIMSQDQIYGFIEKPYFDNDKIRANLAFNKKVTPPDFLAKIEKGLMRDVSIGFYYSPEFKQGHWNGKTYDYIMRDIVIDHVAAGVLRGRCSYPSCGIGVDSYMRRIALDPFGEYTSMQDCISKNQNKKDPAAWCADIHHKITGKWPSEDSHKIKRGENMSLEEMFYPERSKEFNECVKQRMADGMTRGEAEAHCQPATLPKDEPKPAKTLDQEEAPSPPCPEGWHEVDGKCVKDEPPAATEDQEVEPTPLEQCIASQMEGGDKTEEEARAWCEAELAGEHQEATDMIDHSQKLLKLRDQQRIAQLKQQRRSPL